MKRPSLRDVADWLVRLLFFGCLAVIFVQLSHQDQQMADATRRRRTCEEIKNVSITKAITINGVTVDVATLTITYADVVRIAGQGESPIVGYKFRDSGAAGELTPGDRVAASEGLAITATKH